MVEQDSVCGKQLPGFAVIDHQPVGGCFGDAIRAGGVKHQVFPQGQFIFVNITEHFTAGSLIKFNGPVALQDGFKPGQTLRILNCIVV